MPAQSPSSLITNDIGMGNAILYYAPAPFASFNAARSSTKWRKVGLINGNVATSLAKNYQIFYSGYPAKPVARYVDSEEFTITAQALEINPRALARALGGLAITETVKSSSPSATTVAAGSTKSIVNFTSASGYAVDDEIRVGNAGNYQYGRIKSIAANAVTLYEDLDGDTNPTTSEAIAKIDTTRYALGSLSIPQNIAIKLSWLHTGGYGTMDMIVPTAQMSGNLELAFADNAQNGTPIELPLNIIAFSDAAVESGNTVEIGWTQL